MLTLYIVPVTASPETGRTSATLIRQAIVPDYPDPAVVASRSYITSLQGGPSPTARVEATPAAAISTHFQTRRTILSAPKVAQARKQQRRNTHRLASSHRQQAIVSSVRLDVGQVFIIISSEVVFRVV